MWIIPSNRLQQPRGVGEALFLLFLSSFMKASVGVSSVSLSLVPLHTVLVVTGTISASSFFTASSLFVSAQQTPLDSNGMTGVELIKNGDKLFDEYKYDDAALEYWKAILLRDESRGDTYDVTAIFQKFMQCYIIQNKPADGLTFVAVESFRRGQLEMGKSYLDQALSIDPTNRYANEIKEEYYDILLMGTDTDADVKSSKTTEYDEDDDDDDEEDFNEDNYDLVGKTPEQLYELGSVAFSEKNYEECADLFEISCYKSNFQLNPSCSNAVYCRTMILDWGYNGTGFSNDMRRISRIVKDETKQFRHAPSNGAVAWQRASSVHPHMMLGYPISDYKLKRYVTESVAYLDEKMARVYAPGEEPADTNKIGNYQIKPLPDHMPYNAYDNLSDYQLERKQPNFKIRVGFVGSGFNSKAVLYLSQDMFRFFDKDVFDIHIFSIGPADSKYFIQHGMRGVDWRERVKKNVGESNFHDVQFLKNDHIKLAQRIHDDYKIHILIEWDGYARQGERAQGLFALRPAPIQIYHQEYLGTSGSYDWVDYLFTDINTSPPDLVDIDDMYTEKLIFLPNHFFSKGHAFQDEVHEPKIDYVSKTNMKDPYQMGVGTPQENRCMSNNNKQKVDFVFCNFNKFLKNNPETLSSWVNILQQVPNSILCLLENPTAGIPYLRRYVHEYTYETTKTNKDYKYDGDNINSRIYFLPWERNPFDHQRRNFDFCNVMLDNFPYNGHTTAQDSLYAGVPIITRSDGLDMASRVSTSANIVLGFNSTLNAHGGPKHYESIAIDIATDKKKFDTIRKQLINTALQHKDNSGKKMHPYWDVQRYVKNFENGLLQAYDNFIQGNKPKHIYVYEEGNNGDGINEEERQKEVDVENSETGVKVEVEEPGPSAETKYMHSDAEEKVVVEDEAAASQPETDANIQAESTSETVAQETEEETVEAKAEEGNRDEMINKESQKEVDVEKSEAGVKVDVEEPEPNAETKKSNSDSEEKVEVVTKDEAAASQTDADANTQAESTTEAVAQEIQEETVGVKEASETVAQETQEETVEAKAEEGNRDEMINEESQKEVDVEKSEADLKVDVEEPEPNAETKNTNSDSEEKVEVVTEDEAAAPQTDADVDAQAESTTEAVAQEIQEETVGEGNQDEVINEKRQKDVDLEDEAAAPQTVAEANVQAESAAETVAQETQEEIVEAKVEAETAPLETETKTVETEIATE